MKKVLLFIATVLILVLGVWGFQKSKSKNSNENQNTNNETATSNSNTNASSVSISDIKTTPNSDITLYIGQGCPHCAKVEEFIKANKVDEKIAFDLKEVWYNKDNANDLNAKADICKIPQNDLGVPLLFDKPNSKCYVGEDEITNFFNSKINAQ